MQYILRIIENFGMLTQSRSKWIMLLPKRTAATKKPRPLGKLNHIEPSKNVNFQKQYLWTMTTLNIGKNETKHGTSHEG